MLLSRVLCIKEVTDISRLFHLKWRSVRTSTTATGGENLSYPMPKRRPFRLNQDYYIVNINTARFALFLGFYSPCPSLSISYTLVFHSILTSISFPTQLTADRSTNRRSIARSTQLSTITLFDMVDCGVDDRLWWWWHFEKARSYIFFLSYEVAIETSQHPVVTLVLVATSR